MGPAIRSALETLLRDVESDGAPVPWVDDRAWQEWPGAESVMLAAPDGSGTGVWLDGSLSEPERLVHLADQVQEWVVMECCRLRRPTNWPACATHPDTHPLEPKVVRDRAVWVCPVDPDAVRPIGG